MPASRHRSAPLSTVCSLRSGFAFKSGDWTDAGVRVVKIANVRDGRLDFSTVSHVSPETAAAARFAALNHGDILVGMTGYVGSVSRVSSDDLPCVLNQRVGRVQVIDADAADLDFLFFALRSPDAKQQMQAMAHGSAQPNLSPTGFGQVEIALPPLFDQRAIARVLGALDDLIDTNQRLSEAAGALWRSTVASAAEGGDVEDRPLSGLAAFVNGKNFTKGATGRGYPVIRTPEVRVGPTAGTVLNDVEPPDDYLARRGDILFVWSGSLLVDRWTHEPGLVNQHIFKVKPNEGTPDWLVMFAIEAQMQWFLGLAKDKATTMGHIQRAHLDAGVSLPAAASWRRLDDLIRPLWEMELSAMVENLTLRETRDELLPLLLSGVVSPGEVAVA